MEGLDCDDSRCHQQGKKAEVGRSGRVYSISPFSLRISWNLVYSEILDFGGDYIFMDIVKSIFIDNAYFKASAGTIYDM